mgnify:CR=1 FL=1
MIIGTQVTAEWLVFSDLKDVKILKPSSRTWPVFLTRDNLLNIANQIAVIAEGQKGKVKPDFAVNPAWREERYQKLTADTVKIDKAVWDGGAPDIDRAIEDRVAKIAFGDTLVRRRSLKDDNQLRAAIDLLKKAAVQKDVFTAAYEQVKVVQTENARKAALEAKEKEKLAAEEAKKAEAAAKEAEEAAAAKLAV